MCYTILGLVVILEFCTGGLFLEEQYPLKVNLADQSVTLLADEKFS